MKEKNSIFGQSKQPTVDPLSTIRKLSICGKMACYLILGGVMVLVVLSAFFIFGL